MSLDARTLWVGNLSDNVDEDLLYELFTQAGPLENVSIRKGPGSTAQNLNQFAFVTFQHDVSVGYAIALLDGISLYGRPLNMRERHGVSPDYTYRNKMESYMRNQHQQRVRQQRDGHGRIIPSSPDVRRQLSQQQVNYSAFHGQSDPYAMQMLGKQQAMMLHLQQQRSSTAYGAEFSGEARGSSGNNSAMSHREGREPREHRQSRASHSYDRHSSGVSSRSCGRKPQTHDHGTKRYHQR